ncbi:MAG: DNA polymerase III subunit beta [Planctomycetes bacterium]|nr:DNA polymerase III subunit beta [Planctomycetota bacterium]
MKIVCHRESLLNGVSLAASIAPSRSTREILCSVKLIARKSETLALGTDLDVAVCARLREVTVEQEGDVVAPAHTLVDILRSIESPSVTIGSEGRYCEITAEDAQYRLVTDDPEDFPEIPVAPEGGVTVPRPFLEELFARTSFAVARDVGRYAINGLLLDVGQGRITMVATDGRRLAVASRDLPDAPAALSRAVVPVKAFQECLRGSEGCATVRLVIDERRIHFAAERADVSAKPVEGEFPDYLAVVPKERLGTARISRDVLLAAVKKASVLSSEELRAVQIRVDKDRMSIHSHVAGRGEARTEFAVVTEGKEDLSVDFNPDFIIDFLKPLPQQEISFEYKDGGGAGLFRHGGQQDFYVVMPITIS